MISFFGKIFGLYIILFIIMKFLIILSNNKSVGLTNLYYGYIFINNT
jgi:hypothetical protein